MASYLGKERAIIGRLKATGYAAFDGDRGEAIGFLIERFASIAACADTAAREQYMRSLDPRGDGMAEDRQQEATRIAAAGIDDLDRLSAELGLEPFAGVDTSDPLAVARVARDFAVELYGAGTGRHQD